MQTITGKGYRFIAAMAEAVAEPYSDAPLKAVAAGSPSSQTNPPTAFSPSWTTLRRWTVRGLALAAGVVLFFWLIPGEWRDRLLRRQAASSIQSIAVLPFDNLSGDPSKEYFADGLTDELITDLAELTRIRVVSRSSVIRYKGSRQPLPEIARELNVDAIVEGSVTVSEQQVRITAQLIEASNDRHLWARSYERERKDLFPIQREVALTIARLIRAKAETRDATEVSLSPRFTPEAYELNLECRNLRQRGTEEGVSLAIKCYEHVLALDPNCAPAYAGIADSNSALGVDHVPRARAAATKAVELDPSLAEAHDALGNIMRDERDLAGGEREYKRP